MSDRSFTLALIGVLLVAFLVRWSAIAGEPFPINDGGLFLAMIDDLRAADFALPKFTTYNQLDIPFAYPPLPLYVGAIVAAWTPLDATGALRIIPLTMSVLTVLVVFSLARRLLPSRDTALLGTAFLALTPRAFNWEIMGAA